MGAILHREGAPYVFEALAKAQYTSLREWIGRGERQGKNIPMNEPVVSPAAMSESGQLMTLET